MVEVTSSNFTDVLPDFGHSIRKCTFFSVDCEFTALPQNVDTQYSFFDTPEERYRNIRKDINQTIIIQVGITAFRYYRDLNQFKAFLYNFYVFPKNFSTIDTSVLCTSSTVRFLCENKFDFNKGLYGGIHYMNKSNSSIIREQFKSGTLLNHVESNLSYPEIDDILSKCESIKKWEAVSKVGDTCELPTKDSVAFNYALREEVRKIHKNIWSEEKNAKIVVSKVSDEQRSSIEKQDYQSKEHCDLLDNLAGFSKVYDILASSKKPMVGHNCYLDLLALYHQFHENLPENYNEFKKNLSIMFPQIFDTKFISFELQKLKDVGNKKTSLLDVYESYQDSKSNFFYPHIVIDSKGIYEDIENRHGHDAGWDSYMTGFIFLKMADEVVRIKRRDPHLINVHATELFTAIKNWENKVNVARCRAPHLYLAGYDPPSKRPPLLYVRHLNNKCLRTIELDAAFKKYEPLHKRQLNLHSALIAVPNYRSFKSILLDFSNSQELRVEKYSLLRHNKGVQACIIASLLVPVGLAFWYGMKPS